LAGGGGEEVSAADDVGDELGGIVDDDGELVGPEAIGAFQDKVAGGVGEIFGLGAEPPVVPLNFAIGDAEAAAAGWAAGGEAEAAGAGVEFTRTEFGTGAAAGVDLVAELGQGSGVGFVSLALVEDGSVPNEAIGLEGAEDTIGGAGDGAWRVKVLDADEPLAASAPGVEIAGGGGDEAAEVEVAGGRGGEASAVGRQLEVSFSL